MCPVCKSKNDKVLYSDLDKVYKVHLFNVHQKLAVKKCLFCKATFTDPQLKYDELKSYYSEDYGAFKIKKTDRGFLSRFQSFIKKKTLERLFGYGEKKWWRFFFYSLKIPLAHYPSKVLDGKVLDIGCGSGNFLFNLKELGWNVYGVDPSPIAVALAKSRGLENIFQGVIEKIDFKESFFDAIIMFHVFEHIPNPEEALLKIKKILKPNGFLIIGVPNFAGLGSKMFKKYWGGLSFPLHYIHYDKNSLNFLLKKNKFKIINFYYANFFSDILGTSPVNIFTVLFGYKVPSLIQKFFGLFHIFLSGLDYLIGNILSHIFHLGSQITVIGRNNK